MCELMPPPSSTPYPFDIIAVLWNAFDTSSFDLHVWDDDGVSGLPGTSLFSQMVTPPSAGWFEVPVSPPITIPDGQIYVGCLTQVGIGFDETNPDYNKAYWDIGFGWEPMWEMGPDGDFLIRAVIEPTPVQNDVGVVEILAPDTLIEPGQPVQPWAVVQNFGVLGQNSLPVWCLVDSLGMNVYAEVDTIATIASGDTSHVILPAWTPDGGGNAYAVTFYTALIGDEVSENDTLRRAVQTILHDGGVDTILAPPDTVFISSAHYPIATVHNYGNVPESLDVTCEIGSYIDTLEVASLAPGATLPCTLDVWQVPLADSAVYQMTVVSLLIDDTNPANDTLSKSIFAYNPHDVGVDTVLSPPDSALADSAYAVQVVVTNYGEATEDSLEVTCTIDGYLDSAQVVALAPGSSDTVNFLDWTATPPGPWTMCVYSLLTFDRDISNDSLCKVIHPYVGIEECYKTPMPKVFELSQSRPNPFTYNATIRYQIRATERGDGTHVSLRVYDVTGKLVRTVVDKEEEPGYKSVIWDGRDDSGRAVPGGIYFYRLQADRFISTRKAVLVR